MPPPPGIAGVTADFPKPHPRSSLEEGAILETPQGLLKPGHLPLSPLRCFQMENGGLLQPKALLFFQAATFLNHKNVAF